MSIQNKAKLPDDDTRLVSSNFITDIVEEDLASGKYERIVTRFPPEPNGYAHIGHAFASFIDFGVARDFGGRCNLRMDDSNPDTEDMAFVEAIKHDLAWLGWDWSQLTFASDYFEQLYEMAQRLIREGKAYVDSLSEEEIQLYRGTVTEPGKASPYRERSPEESLDLLERMRIGDFPEGSHVLRAKIDMANPNMKLRDPLLYRIKHAHHYRTGNDWHIYPMYDFVHPLSDAIEGVTHSLCSLEFVENRAIYDWLMENLFDTPRPYQYEFGRRSLEYTVVSKRKLMNLVKEGHVSGWDDPRMPTLAGLRRRGVRPEAIRDFASRIGVSRTNRTVDMALLEYAIRDDLNTAAPRVMAVLEPLKVTLSNYPESKVETLEADYWPPDVPGEGTRDVPFSRALYIEREDFAEHPPKGFRRLSPGSYLRLRHAYVIRCDEVIKNEAGEVSELRCSYLPDSLGESVEVNVKGAIHWVAAATAIPAEFRLYDRLFRVAEPEEEAGDFLDYLNPASLQIKQGFVEPSVTNDPKDRRYQFERQGYFWQDPEASASETLVFNRVITLKDSWGKRTTTPVKVEAAAPKVAFKEGEAPDPVLSFSDEQRAKLEQLELGFGLSHDDAVILASDLKLTDFFEDAVLAYPSNHQAIANWIINEARREMQEDDPASLAFSAAALAELIELVDMEVINSRIAKEVFTEMVETGRDPKVIVKAQGLEQVTDETVIKAIIERLMAANPEKVTAYREGKKGLMGFFVGQAIRETGGKANPQLVKSLLEERLEQV